MNAKTPWCGAVKACHWLAACAALAMAACVVAEGDASLVNGTGGGGSIDLDGGRGGSGGTTPTTTKKGSPTPAPNATPKPTPTPAPVNMEADGWEPQTSGVTADLHGITAVGLGQNKPWAWAVGDGGTILRTSDGGANWLRLNSGTTKNLLSISSTWQYAGVASDSFALVAGGTDGALLLSVDSGATWAGVPQPASSVAPDPLGTVGQLEIWKTGLTEKTKGRLSVFVNSARYPLIMTPNASDSSQGLVWDELGKYGSSDAEPIPKRDDQSWPVTLTSADAKFRVSLHLATSTNAYGFLLAWDKAKFGFCPNGALICVGYPGSVTGTWPWRWRVSPPIEGDPTDIAAVPDVDREYGCQPGEFGYVGYLATTKAIYRTSDYGKNWKRILAAGADRILSTGFGRIVAVSSSRIWHAKAVYPAPPPPPATAPPCPKGEPTSFKWIQVIRGTEIELGADDNFLGGVHSTPFGVFPNDLWLVGKGGKILHRLAD